MAEHSAVNRRVVGSSPTRGVWRSSQVVRQWSATPVRTGSNPVCASEKLLIFQELFLMAMRKMQTKSGNKEAGNDETYEVSLFPAFFLLCFFEGVTGSADGVDLYLRIDFF